MSKENLKKLSELLTEFNDSENIGLGEMEQYENIADLISWIDELILEDN